MYSIIYKEMLNDVKELKQFGLSEEELDGYIEFFFDNYFGEKLENVAH